MPERSDPLVRADATGARVSIPGDERLPEVFGQIIGAIIDGDHAALGPVVIGALNLFRPEAGGDVPAPGLGQAMCGLVSIALAQERPARRAERLSERIQQLLNDRGRVEQVSGILAAHLGISPGNARGVLAYHARTSGATVVKVANDVINGHADPLVIAAAWHRRGPEAPAAGPA
jgi:hypothetical protein